MSRSGSVAILPAYLLSFVFQSCQSNRNVGSKITFHLSAKKPSRSRIPNLPEQYGKDPSAPAGCVLHQHRPPGGCKLPGHGLWCRGVDGALTRLLSRFERQRKTSDVLFCCLCSPWHRPKLQKSNASLESWRQKSRVFAWGCCSVVGTRSSFSAHPSRRLRYAGLSEASSDPRLVRSTIRHVEHTARSTAYSNTCL